MGALKSLNRNQKEAAGLLQIGTFLEYFDLMLYVHMAVLLNELFFPETDPHTTALLTAFAFCSTYVLRPFGALIFGYIGDHVGRKSTVVLTTMMMSMSCIIMANLPTYEQIGIAATWIVTICRVVQSISSMGEVVSAQVYMTESTRPPAQYPAVAFITAASAAGGVAALGIAALVTTSGFNWRSAFWMGAIIALIGSIARTRLRETPEFIKKSRLYKGKNASEMISEKKKKAFVKLLKDEKPEEIKIKNVISYFAVNCGCPLGFYLIYIYFNPTLKNSFGYMAEDIISHNFILGVIHFFTLLFLSIISYKFHPLRILRVIGCLFFALAVCLPFLVNYATSPYHILALQSALTCFCIGTCPGDAIFIKHFPVLRRVTATSLLYSLTRAVIYVTTSFGLVYLTEFFGHYGLLLVTLPVTCGFLWAVGYYSVLEDIELPRFMSVFQNRNAEKAEIARAA